MLHTIKQFRGPLLGFAIGLSLSLPVDASAQVLEQDSLALVALYNSTNGPNWDIQFNWLQAPVAMWEGVEVSDSRVTKLDLSDNGLTGELPNEIGNLTKIRLLWLNKNQLSGQIPPAIEPELGDRIGLKVRPFFLPIAHTAP